MRPINDMTNPALMPSRMAMTLKRLVRSVSSLSGELGTSALSLAMLVFLVQEARAAALSQDAALAVQPLDTSNLDDVRQVFGDSAADSVAGIDYTAIADAVAQIADLYAQESLADEGVDLAAEGIDADLTAAIQGFDAEMELAGRYLQDAVQYAQLATGGVAVEGGVAAAETAAGAAAWAGCARAPAPGR